MPSGPSLIPLRNILVLRLSSLGDVALTAPVYRNLKSHWPDCRISALVKPQFAPVLARNPCVDEVLPYRGLLDALRLIRLGGFTHLLDLHANWRTFWIRHLAGVPNTLVYRKDALARRLFVLFGLPSPALTRHTLDRYLERLPAWGVPVRTRELSLGDFGVQGDRVPGGQTFSSPLNREKRASVSRDLGLGARILLSQTSFLGDTLLTVPLARRIKEALPDCRLSVLTRPQTAELFGRSPWVDEVLFDDKRGAHAGLRGMLALARALRAKGFDTAIVAHRSLRSALLVWLARIPYRIGFSASSGSFLFHRKVFFSWGMPELERNLALLLPLKPDLRIEGRDALFLEAGRGALAHPPAVSVEARLAEAGVGAGTRLAALHPGSVWKTKRWPAESYARLASRLAKEAGATVMLVGGPEDAALCAEVARLSGVAALDWAGKTTLPELIALAPRWNLFVTNDSGPMHVAAAAGVPTLALFGPTTRELGFFPYGRGHRVIEADLSCRPCGLHGAKACPEGHFLCMRLISVDEVFQAASRMLAAPAAIP